MLKVTFLLCNHMLCSSVTMPMELLHAAESLLHSRSGLKSRKSQKIEISLVSVDGESVKTHTGINMTPHRTAAEIDGCDILFIPALWRNPRPVIKSNISLIPWIKELYLSNSIIAGVGTGCCFMAEAGLLDNKPATTHWHYFDDFQKQYPLAQLKRAHFITQAGNVYCAGSVNSFAELTVHFIDLFFDRDISRLVERHFFHEIRGAYDGGRAFMDARDTHQDEEIIQAQHWLQNHYAEPVKIGDLSEQLQLSPRTFNRRFKAATGHTPLEYLHKIRMEIARDLLKDTNLSIGEIVFRVGYQDAAHFTALFKKTMGTTPRQYRVTVRGKLFSL